MVGYARSEYLARFIESRHGRALVGAHESAVARHIRGQYRSQFTFGLGHALRPLNRRYTALGAVLGHLFPVWLKFKGGKGVATTLGVLLALAWPVGIGACLTWLVAAGPFRYSSLAALAAIALMIGAAS